MRTDSSQNRQNTRAYYKKAARRGSEAKQLWQTESSLEIWQEMEHIKQIHP